MRLIKIELEDNQIEILCTSLTNSRQYPYNEFKALYYLRWNIEETYKLLKSRIEVEAFSGKTARSVYQDYYAKVLMMTLCATISYPISEKVKQEYKKEITQKKYDQQINKTYAIYTTKTHFINMFFKKPIEKLFKFIDEIIEKTREIIRPERKFMRNHKPKKLYSVNYKPV